MPLSVKQNSMTEKGCNFIAHDNFSFSVVHRNHVQKTFGHRGTSYNALKCHDCHLNRSTCVHKILPL